MKSYEIITVSHAGPYGYSPQEAGRSTCWVDCPFCKSSVFCYVWSLAGSGKKCPSCFAILSTNSASKKYLLGGCSSACSPSDFYAGGRCDRNGCYRIALTDLNIIRTVKLS